MTAGAVPFRYCGAPALPVDARVFDPVWAAHREAALALLEAWLGIAAPPPTLLPLPADPLEGRYREDGEEATYLPPLGSAPGGA